jgi:hypothetical protein
VDGESKVRFSWPPRTRTARLVALDGGRKGDTGQVTGEGEDVALGIREWIEPAAAAVDDDDDLPFPSARQRGKNRAARKPAFLTGRAPGARGRPAQ